MIHNHGRVLQSRNMSFLLNHFPSLAAERLSYNEFQTAMLHSVEEANALVNSRCSGLYFKLCRLVVKFSAQTLVNVTLKENYWAVTPLNSLTVQNDTIWENSALAESTFVPASFVEGVSQHLNQWTCLWVNGDTKRKSVLFAVQGDYILVFHANPIRQNKPLFTQFEQGVHGAIHKVLGVLYIHKPGVKVYHVNNKSFGNYSEVLKLKTTATSSNHLNKRFFPLKMLKMLFAANAEGVSIWTAFQIDFVDPVATVKCSGAQIASTGLVYTPAGMEGK